MWEGAEPSHYSGKQEGNKKMFEFRIINLSDGNQVIDRRLKTPYNSLTPVQMVEYAEMEGMLSLMDRLDRKAKTESERKRNFVRNLLYKLACACGLA